VQNEQALRKTLLRRLLRNRLQRYSGRGPEAAVNRLRKRRGERLRRSLARKLRRS
jgi:hypothetical protein